MVGAGAALGFTGLVGLLFGAAETLAAARARRVMRLVNCILAYEIEIWFERFELLMLVTGNWLCVAIEYAVS